MSKQMQCFKVMMLGFAVVLAGCDGAAAPASVAPSASSTTAATVATAAPTAPAPAATVVPPATVAPSAKAVAASAIVPTVAAPAAGALPTFAKPTNITNPYFPVSAISQTVALGVEGGEQSREEVTLLPDVKTITWAGGATQVRVAQFVAYSDGKLVKVAYDYLAQADNGDVYYFGEDVANYDGGQVSDHEGSWLAGKDGAPPALIMPAQPRVGMVFHPENLPGVVYETDEVVSLVEQVSTPAGPIPDGVLIKELLMDGSVEHKVWAAGFGIVEDRSDDGSVHLTGVSRADATAGVVPGSLQTIEAQAEAIFDDVPGGNWARVNGAVDDMAKAWQVFGGEGAAAEAPQAFRDALATALDALRQAVVAKHATSALQAANDVSAAVVDLFSAYSPAVPADIGRLDVLERQIVLDATAEGAANTLAKIDALWARLKPSILARSGAGVAAQFDASLAAQHAAGDGAALTAEAEKGLELVDALEQLY